MLATWPCTWRCAEVGAGRAPCDLGRNMGEHVPGHCDSTASTIGRELGPSNRAVRVGDYNHADLYEGTVAESDVNLAEVSL